MGPIGTVGLSSSRFGLDLVVSAGGIRSGRLGSGDQVGPRPCGFGSRQIGRVGPVSFTCENLFSRQHCVRQIGVFFYLFVSFKVLKSFEVLSRDTENNFEYFSRMSYHGFKRNIRFSRDWHNECKCARSERFKQNEIFSALFINLFTPVSR